MAEETISESRRQARSATLSSPRANYRSTWYAAALVTSASLPKILNQESSVFIVAVSLVLAVALASIAHLKRKLSASGLIVALSPATFYPPVGPSVNLSLADIIVFLAICGTLTRRTAGRFSAEQGGRQWALSLVVTYALVLQIVAWASLLAASFRGPISLVGVAAALKLTVMTGSVLIVMLEVYNHRVHLVALFGIWRTTSTTVATLALLGYGLQYAGLQTGLTFSYRAVGSFEDPNALATYLLISTAICLAYTFSKYGRVLSWHLIAILAAIVVSGSRAAFLTLAILAVAAILLSGSGRAARRLRLAVLAGAVILGLIWVSFPDDALAPIADRLVNFAERGLADDPLRASLWAAAYELWSARPILGVGIGQFPTSAVGLHTGPDNALVHNTYLSFLAETGLIGLVGLLWLPLFTAAALIVGRRYPDSPVPFFAFSLLSFGVMAAALNLENFRPFWILLGLCLAYLGTSPRNQMNVVVERTRSRQ